MELKKLKNTLPGIGLALGVGLLLTQFPHAALSCLALGVVLTNLPLPLKQFQPGLKLIEKQLLNIIIPLLALNLDLQVIQTLELKDLLGILGLISVTFAAGHLFAKFFNLKGSLAKLSSIGMAICGSSAIAAAAPLITKDSKEGGLAIGVINIMGSIAFLLLPIVAQVFDPNAVAFLLGACLPAVGHVLAAGHLFGGQVAELALSIKLARVALLVPVLFLIQLTNKESKQSPLQALKSTPTYLFTFILLLLCNKFALVPDWLATSVQSGNKVLLSCFLFAVGMSLDLQSIFKKIGQSFSICFFLLIIQIAFCFLWAQL